MSKKDLESANSSETKALKSSTPSNEATFSTRNYETLKAEIQRLEEAGQIPSRIMAAERADWAYGNAVLSNDAVTREMAERATGALPPITRELSHAEVLAQAEDFARSLKMQSFAEVLAALEAGELRGNPQELRARMLRHLLGDEVVESK